MAHYLADFAYDDAGAALVGATILVYTRNTVSLATTDPAAPTTDANGYWYCTVAAEGRYDVKITYGTSVRWRKYDTQAQMDTIEVANLFIRNPADTFDYNIVPAAITADRQLNLPLITGADTLAVLGTAQTFSALQTFGAGFTDLRHVYAIKAADETVNNSAVLQNDNELTIAVVANKLYRFQADLRFISTAVADFKFAFTVPAAAVMFMCDLNYSTFHLKTREIGATAAYVLATDDAVRNTMFFWGYVLTGANAGNVVLQWAQNTAEATDTKVLIGSYLELLRV